MCLACGEEREIIEIKCNSSGGKRNYLAVIAMCSTYLKIQSILSHRPRTMPKSCAEEIGRKIGMSEQKTLGIPRNTRDGFSGKNVFSRGDWTVSKSSALSS